MTYQRTANNCFKLQRNRNIINKEYRVNYAVISNKVDLTEAKLYIFNIGTQDGKKFKSHVMILFQL